MRFHAMVTVHAYDPKRLPLITAYGRLFGLELADHPTAPQTLGATTFLGLDPEQDTRWAHRCAAALFDANGGPCEVTILVEPVTHAVAHRFSVDDPPQPPTVADAAPLLKTLALCASFEDVDTLAEWIQFHLRRTQKTVPPDGITALTRFLQRDTFGGMVTIAPDAETLTWAPHGDPDSTVSLPLCVNLRTFLRGFARGDYAALFPQPQGA